VAEQQQVSIIIDALNRARGVIDKTVKELSGVDEAGKKAGRGLKQAEDGMKKTEKASDNLASSLKKAGAALLAAFTINKILGIARAALEATDELNSMAIAIGISADSLSRFERVAGDANVRAESFRTGMRVLGQAMIDAQDETSKEARLLLDMGIATKDATGTMRPLLDVTMDIADAFRSYQDGAEKSAVATELLGRGNQKMIGVMNLGSEEIKRQMDLAAGLSREQIDTAERFSTLMGQLQGVLTQFGLSVGQVLVPVLSDMVGQLDSAMKASSDWRRSLTSVGDVIRGIASGLFLMTTMLADAVDHIASFARAAGSLMSNHVFRASMGITGLILGPSGDERGAGEAATEAAGELARLQQRSVERYKQMAASAGVLLGVSKAQTIEIEKQAKVGVPPPGQKQAPSVRAIEMAKAEAAKLDLLRTQAEQAYQSSLMDTEALVQSGAISMQDKFEKDRLAALALSEDLKILNAEMAKLAAANPNQPEFAGKLAQGQLGQQAAGLNAGAPGVNDWSAQMRITMQTMRDEFALTAQKVATTFRTTIRGAIDTVSDGITGVIIGTQTWNQALQNIGRTILTSVINAIVKMFAEWIVGRLAMMSVSMAASTAEGATDVAAKTPGALMTSISSWGVAAAVGAAALIAAMAAFGGFAQGGYTGNGPTTAAAGVVHGGEYVIPANVVSKLGPAYFEEYRQGRIPQTGNIRAIPTPNRSGSFMAGGLAPAPSQQTGDRSNPVSIAFLNSRQDMREWMQQEGYKIIAEEAAKRSNTLKS
jgi:hypothetical protein